jgi:hypothetical protein
MLRLSPVRIGESPVKEKIMIIDCRLESNGWKEQQP